MSSSREQQRLRDIIDNIDSVFDYTEGMTVESFCADKKTVDATERCLQRITEATIKIGHDRMEEIAPTLPIQAIRGFGNILRHEYDDIDLNLLFATIKKRLPELRAVCQQALDQSQ